MLSPAIRIQHIRKRILLPPPGMAALSRLCIAFQSSMKTANKLYRNIPIRFPSPLDKLAVPAIPIKRSMKDCTSTLPKEILLSGRKGEPWVWVDELTGTQIPISYRDWNGVWKPEELGLTPWQFTQLFGRHLPGGDVAEPQDDLQDPESRWDVSGKAEINCLGCHNASPLQDQSEWAIQMARENFDGRRLPPVIWGKSGAWPPGWTKPGLPTMALIRMTTEWAVAPFVNYDLTQFDRKHQAFFDVVYKVKDERCLYCHSVTKVDSDRMERQGDVHTAAGIACVDCHRNGLDHQMIRGYPGEADEKGLPL